MATIAQELDMSAGWVYVTLRAVGAPLNTAPRRPYVRRVPKGDTPLQTRVKELLTTEMTPQEIAAQCGCTRSAVSLIARSLGIHRKEDRLARLAERDRLHDEEMAAHEVRQQEALRMWSTGAPIAAIQALLGHACYGSTVQWLVNRRKEDPLVPMRRKASPDSVEEQLALMSAAWQGGATGADLARTFGYRNAESALSAVYQARKKGYADLFPRRRGRESVPT